MRGPARPVPLPVCSRHTLHPQRSAQMRVQARRRQDMQCPLCRGGLCSSCSPAGWTAQHETQSTCPSDPQRLEVFSTAQGIVAEYTTRTFTANDAPQPAPPLHATAICCHRLAAIPGSGRADMEFVELPQRDMPWSPVPIRHAAGVAAWRLPWTCPRGSRLVDWDEANVPAAAGAACPDCGHGFATRPGARFLDARVSTRERGGD